MKNKLKIFFRENHTNSNRVVSTKDGEDLSHRYDCSYIELSALNDKTDVSNVFYELSQQILVRRGLKRVSMLRRPPQIFRRMMNAVRRGSRPLEPVREQQRHHNNAARETNI